MGYILKEERKFRATINGHDKQFTLGQHLRPSSLRILQSIK